MSSKRDPGMSDHNHGAIVAAVVSAIISKFPTDWISLKLNQMAVVTLTSFKKLLTVLKVLLFGQHEQDTVCWSSSHPLLETQPFL